MHVEPGSVDERIGNIANWIQQLALFHNRTGDGRRAAQRVRTAGLGVAANEHGVLSIKKDHPSIELLPDSLQNLRQPVERRPLAHIDNDGRPLHIGRRTHKGSEVG